MNSERVKKAYDALQKRRKKIKRRALFLAGFLLCINTYAWFVYIANASMDVGANVISWDIDFFEEGSAEMNAKIQIPDLYPGMKKFEKKVIVVNDSELDAKFSYELKKLLVFDKEIVLGTTTEEIEHSLANDFPFHITFTKTKETLTPSGDRLEFTIEATWPFESTNPYTKVTAPIFFEEEITYYEKVGARYSPQPLVTKETFDSYKTSGIYLESDDADRFWGEAGNLFQKNHPDLSSIQFSLDLKVSQIDK